MRNKARVEPVIFASSNFRLKESVNKNRKIRKGYSTLRATCGQWEIWPLFFYNCMFFSFSEVTFSA